MSPIQLQRLERYERRAFSSRHLDDATVLRAAPAYEAASPWKDKWPPMLAQMGL